ncbi:MAG: TVP38/TMEM64 family protein [Nanoarchaeota archaeon]|nr:TVP38/TMEM64 family protein [Nanoarchaeota archaeon]
MKTKHHIISYIILGIIILALLLLSFIFPNLKEVLTPSNIKSFILGFGGLALIVYILVLAIAVPAPIPSEPFIFAGGYIFGALLGIPLAFISVVIGSIAYFFLSRWAGRPLLKKMVDQQHLKHFNAIFKKRGKIAVLISYIFPIFPSDSISLFLGTTKISFLSFFLLVVFGHIPRVIIIILLGRYLPTGLSVQNIIIVSLTVILILITFFRHKIKKFLFKEIRELEKEAVKIEKKVVQEEKKLFKRK